ncbi:filamentous hemagglutinin N-terminal domain-containing protein, partial [Veillonella sp. R32]|uniref:two-partner secretion domain-containing protein n=1 Tax=Veillonella sp. R32 TaxID=2021312 RepID=UPI0013898719
MSKNTEQTALRRKITAWITLGIFLVEPMSALGAPIMPDTKAPAVHQPLVQETANGVPLVNITAPTASGVSRNQYEAFNVPAKGAILNNSYTLSETKLAGFVQGNQNMVKGPATIIVNEVTSAHPTAMNGFLEVAGSKASVVIANPNGITVNGGGFINTNQAMLTTGKPIFDATGNLQRLEVTKGQITVEGTGLDARTTSKLDILTRAATMNAGVWGQDINVITGANQVTYETLGTTPIGTAEQEGVALDVGAIGGMYANRIMLIGTARGMGVNMAGRIESDTTLTLDAAGNLHNTGYMQSKGTEAIAVRNLTNTGILATEEIQQIQAEQVQNSGHMVAKAGQTITGHDLTNSGVISSEGTQQLTLQDVTNTGTIYGNTEQIVEARHVINQGRIYSDGNQHLTATSVANEGTIHSQGHQIIAVTDMVTNTGTVQAKQDQAITSPILTNSGTIYSGQNQELQAETITNTGTVYAKGAQQTTTGTLATHNTWGSQGAMKLVVRDSLTNGGLVAAGLTEEGQLTGQSHLNVSAVAVDNAKSQVLSSGQLVVNTQRLNNTDGYVGSQGDMTLTAKEALTNTQGTLVSDGDIHVTAPNITNERGQVTAKGTATMSGQTVDNQSGRITSIEATTIQAKEALQNTRGTITSQGNLTVTTPSVQLDGILAAGTDAVITTTGDITNRNSVDGYGITSAGRHVTIKTTGTIDNEKNIEAGGTLTIQAKGMVQGAHAESNGRDVDLQVATIDNVGLIQADQQLTIGSQTITNHSMGRIYGEAIHMETSSLDNYTDKALEAKLATELAQLKVRETALNAAFAVDVTGFTTRDEEAAYKAKIAEETAKYETQLAVVKDIATQLATLPAGTIAGRTSVAITGDTLRNSNHSLIYSGGDMTLVGKHSMENAGATIEAIGKMTLTTPSLRNTNTAFSSERKITKEAELGDMIRIDQVGHFEQGQSFPKEEFSGLGSGYGATHSTTVTVKEELDEAKYDTVRKLTLKERLAGVEPPDPALIGKYMPNYDYDDPIFAQFGITPMSTPRPVDGDPNQAAWDAQFQALFDQLNPKIRAYNEEVRAYNEAHKTPAIHPYTIQRRHILQSNVFMTSNQNGLIRSGQTMAIHGDVFNENSKFVAGSDMTITGALENPTVKAQEMTYTFGTDQSSYTYKRGWPHKSRRRGYNSEVAVTPTIQLGNPAALGQAGELSHTNTVPAGKDITASKRADVAQVLDPFTPTKAQADNTSVTARVAPIEPITLPSLYFVHPESTAKYLVETDSRFTNKKEFLSSDYMIYQLGWNPDRVQKKLGDGFYEQSLIRDQVMALTGKRYIDGYSNDEEGYKALMDQGVAFAKQYNLTMGVSLTKEQMAQLTSDIVWLESKEVTVNGETYTVLYPHVYMHPGQTMTLETDGSLIRGKNLVVKTTKAIENEGTLLGDTLVLTGSSIRNSGLIAGGSILANSTGNIESTGQIRGTNRVQLLADEDIAIHNTINQYKNQEAYNQTAGIAVTGNEGVLLLGAKKDLTIQGAVLQNLGTNGSTVLQAGQTVSLMADTVSSKKATVLDAKNYSHSYDRLDNGAIIQTAGDLVVVAGDSIQAKAATVQSEAGAVQLEAGKDISLTSGEAIHNQDYGISYKSRGLLSSKKTTIQTE